MIGNDRILWRTSAMTLIMRVLFPIGIAALFLATGTAHACED
jgi:hypothetical protein